MPQLRATSVAVLILNLIAAYQAFDEFYNLIGNVNFARPPLVYLYGISLGTIQDLGHGSAGALILAVHHHDRDAAAEPDLRLRKGG